MLQIARLAPTLLGKSSALVRGFIKDQLNPDGGFRDRSGRSDLYYTVFGLEALMALDVEIPADAVRPYLRSFGPGQSLDLVHLACLARCWAMMPPPRLDDAAVRTLLDAFEQYRTDEGGYHPSPGAPHGTAYHAFLALGAYEDLRGELPRPASLRASIESLCAADGSYGNEPGLPAGSTPATAAAVMVLRHLDATPEDRVTAWLLSRCHADGGFFASPSAPIPDLLSTATALHALSALHAAIEPIAERCLDFLDSLWTKRGAFFGTWADDEVDCEYTYYGLLALGHLSLAH
jgi:prenyltransferase beta subunit